MKTFEFTLKHDGGNVTIRTSAETIEAAKATVCSAEKCPASAIQYWRVVPTARQIARTKSLMRGI